MKTAVLYSGNIRSWPTQNHKKLWEGLDVDIYYGVWDDDDYYTWLPSSFKPIVLERPKFLGHPLRSPEPWGGCYTEKNKLFMKHIYRSLVSPAFYEWYKYGHYQIYAHALLCTKIPNYDEYDLIIKTRYDVHFIEETKSLIERIQERALNFNLVSTFCNGSSVEYDDVEKTTYKKTSPKSSDMTEVYSVTGYMCDHVIFYTHGMFNPDLVFDLYKQRKLLPCELGWGQVMCERKYDDYKTINPDLPLMFREYYDYSFPIDTSFRRDRRNEIMKDILDYTWMDELYIKIFEDAGYINLKKGNRL